MCACESVFGHGVRLLSSSLHYHIHHQSAPESVGSRLGVSPPGDKHSKVKVTRIMFKTCCKTLLPVKERPGKSLKCQGPMPCMAPICPSPRF